MPVCVSVSYMWLSWDGFSDGLSRFASSISLKPELPTFLANWEREKTEYCCFIHKEGSLTRKKTLN